AGPAKTVLVGPRRGVEGYAQSKYAIIADMNAGEVLVVGGVETTENQIGGNVALFGQMQGLAAIVCGTPVRDREEMMALKMPVFASAFTARMPVSTDTIAINVPVVCGGSQVRPGDAVVGSKDGVLVIPKSKLDDILFELEEVEKIETALQKAVRDGKTFKEIEALAGQKKKPRAR